MFICCVSRFNLLCFSDGHFSVLKKSDNENQNVSHENGVCLHLVDMIMIQDGCCVGYLHKLKNTGRVQVETRSPEGPITSAKEGFCICVSRAQKISTV